MIELVIKIDDNLYTRLFDNGVDNYDDAVDMAKAIRKGTVLPKGHGDLIDSNILCEQYEKTYDDLYQALDLTPSIIEADEGE